VFDHIFEYNNSRLWRQKAAVVQPSVRGSLARSSNTQYGIQLFIFLNSLTPPKFSISFEPSLPGERRVT